MSSRTFQDHNLGGQPRELATGSPENTYYGFTHNVRQKRTKSLVFMNVYLCYFHNNTNKTLWYHPIPIYLYSVQLCASFDTKFDCIIYLVNMLCVIICHVLYTGPEIACSVIYKNALKYSRYSTRSTICIWSSSNGIQIDFFFVSF